MKKNPRNEQLEVEIESERSSIADLQERVKGIVRRREETASRQKAAALGELQRKIEALEKTAPAHESPKAK